MPKYEVSCVKHGSVVVEAESECKAVEIAESLPDSSVDWEGADEYEVVRKIN